jgi:hypothetical protein
LENERPKPFHYRIPFRLFQKIPCAAEQRRTAALRSLPSVPPCLRESPSSYSSSGKTSTLRIVTRLPGSCC